MDNTGTFFPQNVNLKCSVISFLSLLLKFTYLANPLVDCDKVSYYCILQDFCVVNLVNLVNFLCAYAYFIFHSFICHESHSRAEAFVKLYNFVQPTMWILRFSHKIRSKQWYFQYPDNGVLHFLFPSTLKHAYHFGFSD